MLQRQIPRLALSAALLSSLLPCAHAVELGDALVRSHIGQPLSADIELTGIVDDKATVQAGLADPEVYRGANVAMHPALSSLNITIVRREGRRYLHITSPRQVESEFVHVFFELTENGRRSVRQATLWFTADPNPAPPPAKVAPAPVAAPAVVPAALPARARAPAPMAAALQASVAAPILAAVLRAPPPRPIACAPQFSAAQIGACTALDAKNAALNVQIVDLEEKVGRLSAAMQAGAAPLAAAPPAKPIPPKLTPMKPMGAAAAKSSGATPWLFIAVASAAVFALVAALLFILWRKRKATKVTPVAKARTGLIASVKNRLLPAKKETEPLTAAAPAAV